MLQPIAPSLGRSTANGILWLLLQAVSGKIGSFLSQLILAKLLMPEAFGTLGLAYTVSTLINAFVSFGIDDILLQRMRTMYLWVSAAFWTSLGAALLGMVLMLLAAPLAARIYANPNLVGLIALLALNMPLGALATVPTVRLRSALKFRYLGVYAGGETAAIQIATVVLALLGCGAYSFILPLPVAAAVKAWVFWRRAPSRIRWRFHRVQLLHITSSSFFVQGTRIVNEAVNQGGYIVLGLLTSDAKVGVYYFAFRLAVQPLAMLAGNFGSVLFPALTQLRAEPHRQEQAALRASRVLGYVVTPACFLQAALAGPLLQAMFGTKWIDAIPLIQILSIGLPGDAAAWIAGALLVARREFKRDFFYLIAFALPFFVAVTIGAWLSGSLGVAIAVALYYMLLKPINSWLVFRRSMQLADLLHTYVIAPLMAALAMGAAYAASRVPALAGHPLEQMVAIFLIGPPTYLVMLRLAAPAMWNEVLERFPLSGPLRRLRAR